MRTYAYLQLRTKGDLFAKLHDIAHRGIIQETLQVQDENRR